MEAGQPITRYAVFLFLVVYALMPAASTTCFCMGVHGDIKVDGMILRLSSCADLSASGWRLGYADAGVSGVGVGCSLVQFAVHLSRPSTVLRGRCLSPNEC